MVLVITIDLFHMVKLMDVTDDAAEKASVNFGSVFALPRFNTSSTSVVVNAQYVLLLVVISCQNGSTTSNIAVNGCQVIL